ncbi:MAG TPA: VCBS repeat-containing protein [Vitreimonas sp.]|uniref:FG-GAP repeat domain-containing protein n=1 Tax=Vitreimonas sp. TaxID=3069702 RepID=UPI002D37DE60|nr:VCBS repeat-containing protein [Vitreimonas sp.]HYD87487.1 VCBS repeat-containing protein [Vitreimonas sp.]
MRIIVAACAALVAMGEAAQATPWFTDATANLPNDNVAYASMDAVAADLDGDGDLDVVTPQEWRSNRILINDGSGRFTLAVNALPAPPPAELTRPAHIQHPLQKDSEDVSIADFDRDGDLDLILVVEDDQRLGRSNVHQYFRARGDRTYERVYGQLPDSVANAVAHADITGDGADDVIVSGDGQDRLLINDGRGGFRDETAARLPTEASIAQDVEFLDIDRDGDLDLVLGLEGGHALWINDGEGRFHDETAQRLPPAGNVEARKVTPADVDGDGDLDLYFAHVSWQGRAPQDRLYINDGRGRFADGTAERLPVETDLGLDAEFADFDGDGDLDAIIGNGGPIRILANDGAGRFADVTDEALGVDVAGVNIAIEVADFNGDGRPDFYVGQLGAPNAPPARDRLFLNVRRA